MTQRQGRAFLGNVAGRSAAGGLLPSDTVNIIQSLGQSFNVGPFQGSNAADFITLSADIPGASRYTSFRLTMSGTGTNTGNGYTVPAGRQLIIGVVIFATTVANIDLVIGYGETSVDNSVAAPTNAVGLTSANALAAVAARTNYAVLLPLKVPAGKIPYAFSVGGTISAVVVALLFNA